MKKEECRHCGVNLKRKRVTGLCIKCLRKQPKSSAWKASRKLTLMGNRYALGKKYSEETRKRISEGHKGAKNYAWKGEGVGYQALHSWINRTLGKANFCTFDVNHKSTRFHWANVSKEYKRELNDWMSLCPSCHAKYDFTEEKRERLRQINLGNKNAVKNYL